MKGLFFTFKFNGLLNDLCCSAVRRLSLEVIGGEAGKAFPRLPRILSHPLTSPFFVPCGMSGLTDKECQ